MVLLHTRGFAIIGVIHKLSSTMYFRTPVYETEQRSTDAMTTHRKAATIVVQRHRKTYATSLSLREIRRRTHRPTTSKFGQKFLFSDEAATIPQQAL